MTDPLTLRLLQQADSGCPAALDALFDRERCRLRRLLSLRASKALLARVDLDDLIQETYLEALKQFSTYSYQGKSSFFRWLGVIAVHRLQNIARNENAEKRDAKREVRIGTTGSVDDGFGVAMLSGNGPGPKTLAVGADEVHRLEAGLSRLGPEDREVILLSRLEGHSLTEVSERLGRTKNATALLLSRALRKLKRELGVDTESGS